MENRLDKIRADLKSEIITEIKSDFKRKIAEIISDFETKIIVADLRADFKRDIAEIRSLIIEHPKVFGLFFEPFIVNINSI